ncbi:MAG: hypothetical protein JWL57_3672 [Actinobacteria bacterium]|nr:hypothetical protein [Actinomycetota bacterium]
MTDTVTNEPEVELPAAWPADKAAPSGPATKPKLPDPLPDTGSAVTLAGVGVAFGAHQVVRDVTFDLARNRVTALVGPSGCG